MAVGISLSVYKFLSALELLAALALFVYRFRRRKYFALRLAGSKSVIDMIVPAQDKPVHAKGNAALAACYARALEKAVSLIGNLRGFLAGEEALDEAFSSNYESEEKI